MLAIFLTPGLLLSSTRLANQAVVRLRAIRGAFQLDAGQHGARAACPPAWIGQGTMTL